MQETPETPEFFELGALKLQSGQVLEQARLAYVTRGTLNRARDNAVLLPTYYGGTHHENLALIGPGRALDPARYFIVIPNLFGNGISTSPSNHPSPPATAFPRVTVLDNVNAQQRLLQSLRVECLALACGWALGAQQAYHHAALFPERVERALVICASARTSPQQVASLEETKAVLLTESATPAHDLLTMLDAWQRANIADNDSYAGDLERALRTIQARVVLMPSSSDRLVPVAGSQFELTHLRRGELRVIKSPLGHDAGAPDRVAEDSVVERVLRELLES
jgi:homoserine O-acetyltransferase/O-succinyltransferase